MKPITITLRRIMDCKPCYDPIERGIFEKDHDLDAPITFRWLAERIPLNDMIWCFLNLPDEYDSLKRHFAVDYAERFKYLMQDERSFNALRVARKHILGQASDDDLMSARAAAWDAWAVAEAEADRAGAWIAARVSAREATVAANITARAEDTTEEKWKIKRIIELTDAGEWSPVGEK